MHLGEQTRAVHDREEKNAAKGIVHYVKNSTEHLFIPLASRQLHQEGHEDLTFHSQVSCSMDSHETPYLHTTAWRTKWRREMRWIYGSCNEEIWVRTRRQMAGKLLKPTARAEWSTLLETTPGRDLRYHADQMIMRCLELVARRFQCKSSRYQCP